MLIMIKCIGENGIFTEKTTEELSDTFREKLVRYTCAICMEHCSRYIHLPAICTLILHLKLTLKYTFKTDTYESYAYTLLFFFMYRQTKNL